MVFGFIVPLCALGQGRAWLDPTRGLPPQALTRSEHTPLTEQYIWLAQSASPVDVHSPEKSPAPVYFRRSFSLSSVPESATLYVGQSGSVEIYLNGRLVSSYQDSDNHLPGLTVSADDVHHELRRGENVLALRVVAGPGSHHTTSNPFMTQLTSGHALVAKLVAAPEGVDLAPLLVSDARWTAASTAPANWFEQEVSTDWPKAVSMGAIDDNIAFRQWNADAGLNSWPGYEGLSPFLRHFSLGASRTLHVYPGYGQLEHLDSLVSGHGGPFVAVPAEGQRSPSLMLDFGREVSGRLRIANASDQQSQVQVAYGESEEEALYRPYLGVRRISLPPHGVAFAPKSAFRYALLSFPQRAELSAVDLDGITYPVEYRGSFRSSDELLNRIWETGAYTAHLCMLDGIWDGAKRDRARWMGDLDVTGRTISAVFADRFLMEETLEKLIRDRSPSDDVNTIHGYSPLWISGLADFYRHTGDRTFLERLQPDLLQLLTVMDAEFDERHLFDPAHKQTTFVDWSDGLKSDTPEARRATHLEFIMGYREAAFLLDELGDKAAADLCRKRVTQLTEAAQMYLRSPGSDRFGERWQTNAMAIVSGVATPSQEGGIWQEVLSHSGTWTPETPSISPYYSFYLLRALAESGHVREALDWMRSYWGGMLAEGASSFWEVYDPRWPRQDFHSALQADEKVGYYASLAHGWSSGAAPWLMEEILGIHPTGAGFSTVLLRPDLAGLEWAEGSEPTPNGDIAIRLRHTSAHETSIHIDLPPRTIATLSLPTLPPTSTIRLNEKPVRLSASGEYVLPTAPLGSSYDLIVRF